MNGSVACACFILRGASFTENIKHHLFNAQLEGQMQCLGRQSRGTSIQGIRKKDYRKTRHISVNRGDAMAGGKPRVEYLSKGAILSYQKRANLKSFGNIINLHVYAKSIK